MQLSEVGRREAILRGIVVQEIGPLMIWRQKEKAEAKGKGRSRK